MSKSTGSKEESNPPTEHNHSKSLFQEDPQISGPPALKFFGRLGSLPSYSLVTVTCSGSDVNKKPSGSPPDQLHGSHILRENHGTISNEVDETKQTVSSQATSSTRSASEENGNRLHYTLTEQASSSSKRICTENEGRFLQGNLNYGRNACMPKAKIVESWIQNIQQSITAMKAKNAPLFEEVEEYKRMEDESSKHISTLDESMSISSGIDNIRRVIVCDSSFSSVPKVIMCDKNCEAVSYSEYSDSENNQLSSPVSATNNEANNAEEEFSMALDLESRTSDKEEQHKRNYNFMRSGRVPDALSGLSSQPVTELAGGADDEMSRTHSNATTMETSSMNSHNTLENEKITSETDRCSTDSGNAPNYPSQDSLVSAKSSFYEPAGHVRSCCLAGNYNLQPPAPTDPVCSPNSPCGHVPIQRSVTPLRQMFDSGGSQDQLEEYGNAASCGHNCEACAMNAAAQDNCVSKGCPSHIAMKVKRLEDELDRLGYELRQRDCKILQLQNQIQCIQCETEPVQKPTSSETTVHSNTPNREEKLQELSNSVSSLQRSIDIYCSCMKEDPYNHEVQLREMEMGVGKIKEELDKLGNDRLEAGATYPPIPDCDRSEDQNLASSERTEADSYGTSSQQINDWSSQSELPCQNHGAPADDPCTKSETSSLKTPTILDLQSDLNRKIDDLQIKVSMLKSPSRVSRVSPHNKDAESSICCCKYCGADQSSNLENQTDSLVSKVDEIQRYPLLHSMEVRQLAEILNQAKATQAVLTNELESNTSQVEELKNNLMTSESRISNLFDKLKEEMMKDQIMREQTMKDQIIRDQTVNDLMNDHTLRDLQNQIPLRAGGSTEEQTNCEQNCDCRELRELEEKLNCSERLTCSQEKAIKDLEQNLESYQTQVSDYQERLKNQELMVADLREKFECCQKKLSELGQQLESRDVKIVNLESELKGKDECCNRKLLEMENKFTKELEAKCMKIAMLEQKKSGEICSQSSSEIPEDFHSTDESQLKCCAKDIACLEERLKEKEESCARELSEMNANYEAKLECSRKKIAGLKSELQEKDEECAIKISELEEKLKAELECARKKIVSLEAASKTGMTHDGFQCDKQCAEFIKKREKEFDNERMYTEKLECEFKKMEEEYRKQCAEMAKKNDELECSSRYIESLEAQLQKKDEEWSKKMAEINVQCREMESSCMYIEKLESDLQKKDEQCRRKCAELSCKCEEELECNRRYIANLESEVKQTEELCNRKLLEMATKCEQDLEQNRVYIANLEAEWKKKEEELRRKYIATLEAELNKKDEECRISCSKICLKCEEELACERQKVETLELLLKKKEEECCRNITDICGRGRKEIECHLKHIAGLEAELKKKDEECSQKCLDMCSQCEKELECAREKITNLEAELRKKEKESTKRCSDLYVKCEKELECARQEVAGLEAELRKKDKECSKKCSDMYAQCEKDLECAREKVAGLEAELRKKDKECSKRCSDLYAQCEKELECTRQKLENLEAELKKSEEIICTLSNEILNCETKNKELLDKLKFREDELNCCQSHLKAMEETQKSYAVQSEILQRQIQSVENQLSEIIAERDLLLKEQKLCALEIRDLQKSKKKLEKANYCLAREISAEVERLKVDLMVKLHNFCPLITSLEMTRTELEQAMALFEDAERRCCSLNDKLNQTNEELQALKAMKQSASKASKLLHNCSEKSLENQALLAEACEDLTSLNSEKTVLRSAVESLMVDNEEKDQQLCDALREMEELKREIETLRIETEEKQCN